jgi:erythronate-4-phosphate dehydrogenase
MNILIDDTIFNAKEIFAEFGDIITKKGREINANDTKNCDILIVRSRTKVDENLLKNSTVKFVGSAVAGLDHIDLDYLKSRNIKFAHAGGCNANAVAEFVIANILNLAKKYNFDYKDKVLGIVGVGNVGTKLKAKAEKLGIKLLLNDIKDGKFDALEKVLSESDILTFHTPLTKTGKHPTYKMLGENNFHLLKKDCIIFNAARGGVIDENSWLKHSGIKIVDCWENEPNINQELLKVAELGTSHIAGHSIDAKFQGSYMIYQQLCDFLGFKSKEFKIDFNHQIDNDKSFLDFINKVYDFAKDDEVLRSGDFEDYRRFYPDRFEWENYQQYKKYNL